MLHSYVGQVMRECQRNVLRRPARADTEKPISRHVGARQEVQ